MTRHINGKLSYVFKRKPRSLHKDCFVTLSVHEAEVVFPNPRSARKAVTEFLKGINGLAEAVYTSVAELLPEKLPGAAPNKPDRFICLEAAVNHEGRLVTTAATLYISLALQPDEVVMSEKGGFIGQPVILPYRLNKAELRDLLDFALNAAVKKMGE